MIDGFQKYVAVLLLFSIFCSPSCKDKELAVLATIPYRVEFEIPAGLNIFEDHFFPFPNQPNTFESILEQRGVDLSRVQRINPATARLTVQFEDASLNFIREASIYLFSDQVGRDSEAFWTPPEVPFSTGSTLGIPGTLIDAQDFFDQQWINFELRLDTRETTTSFLQVRLDITFNALGE